MPAIPKPVYIHRFVINDGLFDTSSSLYFTITGGSTFTQSNADAMGEAVASMIADPLPDLLSTQAKLKAHYGKLLTPTQEFESAPSGLFGGFMPIGNIDADPMPTESVAEIQRRTGLPGRNNRGRIFISGIPELGTLKGTLTPGEALATALIGFAAALSGTVTVGTFILHPAHWDRKTNTMRAVTTFRAMSVLLSRRDRRRHLIPAPLS